MRRPTNNNGQALVEWCVWAGVLCVVWTIAMQMALRLLHRTSAQAWGVQAARQALSQASTVHPLGLGVKKEYRWLNRQKPQAKAGTNSGQAVFQYQITVPKTAKPAF